MKQRPILFNGEMVRAILCGQKTQTRRVMKVQPLLNGHFWQVYGAGWSESVTSVPAMPGHSLERNCPFGQPGDQLWLREAWQYYDWSEDGMPCIRFAADNQTMWVENADESAEDQWEILSRPANYNIDNRARDRKWRPSIHMPRWASRITLEITSIRVERLNDISEDDAKAEGAIGGHGAIPDYQYSATPLEHFKHIWESTCGDWEANPWVWVLNFQRVEQ